MKGGYTVQLHALFSLRCALPCIDGDVFRHVLADPAATSRVEQQAVRVPAGRCLRVAVAAARVDAHRVAVRAGGAGVVVLSRVPIDVRAGRAASRRARRDPEHVPAHGVAVRAGGVGRGAVAVRAAADAVRVRPRAVHPRVVCVGDSYGIIAASSSARRVGGIGEHEKVAFQLLPLAPEKRLGICRGHAQVYRPDGVGIERGCHLRLRGNVILDPTPQASEPHVVQILRHDSTPSRRRSQRS